MFARSYQVWRENRGFIFLILCMFAARSTVADWNTVPTGSMKPTILEGDRIWVNKLAYDVLMPFTHLSLYHHADPQRGEIIVFESAKAEKRLVKRVIGLPGDRISLRDNRLTINGKTALYSNLEYRDQSLYLTESVAGISHLIRIDPHAPSRLSNFGPVKVPAGHYLVLGDNRDNSADSRVFGFVPREEVIGRSNTVVMSLDYGYYYLPRAGRFLQTL